MNILFAHQNFPGQFKHLASYMAASPNNRVVALHINTAPRLPGVEMVTYSPERGTTPKIHPWVSDLETKVIRGEAAYRAAKKLKQSGFNPDVIVAHPGWGESLFLKDVWPSAEEVQEAVIREDYGDDEFLAQPFRSAIVTEGESSPLHSMPR